MEPLVATLLLMALLVGLGVGWGLASRGVVSHRAERDAAEARARTAEAGLAVERERSGQAELLRMTLDQVSRERDEARTLHAAVAPVAERVGALEQALAAAQGRAAELAAANAAHESSAAERARAHEAQLEQLRQMETRLNSQFGELAGKALGDAQARFLERASERFKEAGNENEARVKAVLAPVETSLKRYEEGVAKVEEERRREQSTLAGVIQEMRVGQDAVRSEAARLVNSLRAAPKARGRWGEQQLKNVLESCGLAEHTDFRTEVSVTTEDGRLRPDAVITVPGGKSLVVDAKVSLNAYQDAFNAVDDDQRRLGLAAHAAAMKAHVTALGGKDYTAQFADAPDYVIMFVPGEHFLSAALEHDAGLWDYAFAKRVLLATPTNLIAIARTVSAVWRQEKLAKEAERIGALGKEMHERLAVAADALRSVGGGLSSAVNAYNKFVSSFEGRLMVTGRKFKELNVDTGPKELKDVPPVEALPRYGDLRLEALAAEAAE